MENNQESTDKNQSVVFIPRDAIMNVEISGDYLARCHAFLIGVCNNMENEKLKKAFENFKDDKEPESIEEHVIFMMTPLIHAIETAAKDQSKTVTKTFTPEEIAQIKKAN